MGGEAAAAAVAMEGGGAAAGAPKSRFYSCYLLCSLSPCFKRSTYIGFTVNPLRRLRQHNGEIKCGAWKTKRKRPWEMILCIYGFPNHVCALQFEWAWKHPLKSLAVRDVAQNIKPLNGVRGKIKVAYTMLTLPEWKNFNLTINFFSTKYIHHTKEFSALPHHMQVTFALLNELPCYQAVVSGRRDAEIDRNIDVHDLTQSEDSSPCLNKNNTSKETHRSSRSVCSSKDPKVMISEENFSDTNDNIAESTDIDSVIDMDHSPILASPALKHYDEYAHHFRRSQLVFDLNYRGKFCKSTCQKILEKDLCSMTPPESSLLQPEFCVSSSPALPSPQLSAEPCLPSTEGCTMGLPVSPLTVVSIASAPKSSFSGREVIDLTDSPVARNPAAGMWREGNNSF